MSQFLKLQQAIRLDPYRYLEEQSLAYLAEYMRGFILGSEDAGHPDPFFSVANVFNKWMTRRLKLQFLLAYSWETILSFSCKDQHHAFWKYFQLWDEFVEIVRPVWPTLQPGNPHPESGTARVMNGFCDQIREGVRSLRISTIRGYIDGYEAAFQQLGQTPFRNFDFSGFTIHVNLARNLTCLDPKFQLMGQPCWEEASSPNLAMRLPVSECFPWHRVFICSFDDECEALTALLRYYDQFSEITRVSDLPS